MKTVRAVKETFMVLGGIEGGVGDCSKIDLTYKL